MSGVDIWKSVLAESKLAIEVLSYELATKKREVQRLCARCCHLADKFKFDHQYDHPREVHSWVRHNVRYYAGLCKECGELEAMQRGSLRAQDQKGRAA